MDDPKLLDTIEARRNNAEGTARWIDRVELPAEIRARGEIIYCCDDCGSDAAPAS